MIFESEFIEPLKRMLRSPCTSENTSRLKKLPSGTPPRPV